MASAYAKNVANLSDDQTDNHTDNHSEMQSKASGDRLGEAFALLEYKVQQLISRQHQELTRLHLRLQEAQAMGEEIADDLFFQADIAREKSSIQAELDAVNAREYEIRRNAHGMIKGLENAVRTIRITVRAQ